MRSHRHRGPAWTTGVLLIALAVSLGLPAASASASLAPAAPAAPAASPPGTPQLLRPATGPASASAVNITLITGDVVSYTSASDVQVRATGRLDGAPAVFMKLTKGGDTYVIPGDALGAIAAGNLDMSLFDVSYLAANGYDDKATKQIPLIVSYRSAPAGSLAARAAALDQRAAALPAAAPGPLALAPINGAAVKVGKTGAGRFWAATAGRAALGEGLARIWLDRRVHADLSPNMRQIDAPRAWEAGYDGTGVKVAILDTGIDLTHPDLAGKVAASAVFTGDASVQDGFGHGTHVAGILAGSGAASGGEYRGVAPGASLLIGKVLDNTGTGDDSGVMAGMQWAVAQGARVVSMSLGDNDFSDGTDPLSEMVDALSASSGALFVIAAANAGPAVKSVSAPGTADAALTVAAVDGSGATASFSSRGPRDGDWALKPDISAPGVDITAARAAGTTLGPVVDGQYVTLSGTSMATPHVAGSAAILAQEHPDWTGQQIKQALISSASDTGAPAWEQGSGVLDIGRAATQQVFASGNVDFGRLAYPQAGPVTKPLTYTNDSSNPVTLSLKATLTAYKGTAAAGELALDHSTVTVPADGTATVGVTFDPTKGGDATYYSGEIQAQDATGAVDLTDAVGAFVEPKTSTLSATLIPPAGATSVSVYGWYVFRVDDKDILDGTYQPVQPGLPTMRLASYAGDWAVEALVSWIDASGAQNVALVTDPQITMTGDTHVTLDLNKAVQITVRTPAPLQRWRGTIGFQRSTTVPGQIVDMYADIGYGNPVKVWMLPTQQVTDGTLREYEEYLLGPDRIEMTAQGVRGLTLHPLYSWYDTEKMFDGTRSLPLADAGDGTAAGLAGNDVKGKLALVNLADICPDPANCDTDYYAGAVADRVAAVNQAGAAGFLGYGTDQVQFQGPHMLAFDPKVFPVYPLPTLGVPAAEGRALAAALSQHPVTMRIRGQAGVPAVDALEFQNDGRIPASLSHTVGPDNLRTEVNHDHADNPAIAVHEWTTLEPDGSATSASTLVLRVPAPGDVTAYVGPVSHSVLWDSDVYLSYDTPAGAQPGQDNGPAESREFFVTGPDRVAYDWAEGPVVPGAPRVAADVLGAHWIACMACRSGDYFTPMFVMSNDGFAVSGEASWDQANINGAQQDTFHLYQDGAEIPIIRAAYCPGWWCFGAPAFKMSPDPAQYRLTEDYTSEFPMARYDDRIHTEWTFDSQRPGQSATPYSVCPAARLYDLDQRVWLNVASNASCAASSQLYLGYDLGLDPNNQLRAGAVQPVSVTVYQSGLLGTQAPRITSLKLWLTFDDGATWIPVPVRAGGNGAYSALLANPAVSKTVGGTVGLRAEATDAAGDTVSQIIHDAYGLSAAG